MIGTVAQLVERMFRIYEARGSTPLCSTFYSIYLKLYYHTKSTHKQEKIFLNGYTKMKKLLLLTWR